MYWKMIRVFIFLLSVITFTSTEPDTGEIDYDSICMHTEYWASPVCLPDKTGYFQVYCSSYMDWTKGEWVWNREKPKRITLCGKDEVCECKTTWCTSEALCHEKRLAHPVFPRTGLLEYTGTTDGQVARDTDGRWYHEYSRYRYPEGWARVFELILPYYYNDAFIKYSGRVGDRKCDHEEMRVNDRKLFEPYHSPTSYRKIFQGHQNGHYVQKWQLKNFDLDPWWDVYDTATYTYIYDNVTNTGVPLKYEHYYKFDSSERTDVRKYVYNPHVDDKVFDVVRYCDGIWLYSRSLKRLDP